MSISFNSSFRSSVSTGSKSVTFADESFFNERNSVVINKTDPTRGILKKPRSHSKRAGIVFPAKRMKLKKAVFPNRVGGDAPICLAAILQCLVAKVISLAGIVAEIQAKPCINPNHLQIVISNNTVLFKLLTGIEKPETSCVSSCLEYEE